MTLKNLPIDATWTLFLDRDGVINQRLPGSYIMHKDEFVFLPGAIEALASLSKHFTRIFVVTNQQGIGKGLMTEADLHRIHRHLRQEVEKAGGQISKIYYAPDLAGPENYLRKPRPGMGLWAKREFPAIDFTKALMVGDSETDIGFGQNLQMKTVKIGPPSPYADFRADSLSDFARELVKKQG